MDYFSHAPRSSDEMPPPAPESWSAIPYSQYLPYSDANSSAFIPKDAYTTEASKDASELEKCDSVDEDVAKLEIDVENLLSLGEDIKTDVENIKRNSSSANLQNHSRLHIRPHIRSLNHTRSRHGNLRIGDMPSPKSTPGSQVRPPTPGIPSTSSKPPLSEPDNTATTSLPQTLNQSPNPPNSTPPTNTSPPSTAQPTPQLTYFTPPRHKTLNTKQDLLILRAAVKVVHSHIAQLDEGIKANIAAQLADLAGSDDESLVVVDEDNLPSFLVPVGGEAKGKGKGKGKEVKQERERKQREVSKGLVEMVKVCCVVERGLMALNGVLEEVESSEEGRGRRSEREGEIVVDLDEMTFGSAVKEKEREKGLLGVCLDSPGLVRQEMGHALDGIEGVIAFRAKGE